MGFDYSLYLVTDRALSQGRDLLQLIQEAVQGGVTAVQLREKQCETREFVHLAKQALALLQPLGVPLFINDRLDVALAVDAQGLHVGQEDMHVLDVRQLAVEHLAVGLSVNTTQHCQEAEDLPVDYLGVGPIFGTQTKKDAKKALGLERLSRIRKQSSHTLVGIGGIDRANAAQVIQAGADGIAVVSAICASSSPQQEARYLLQAVRQACNGKNM
ncbi:MAG: thiamine phosphate synthase [Thermodesulfobacteriota bacterium]